MTEWTTSDELARRLGTTRQLVATAGDVNGYDIEVRDTPEGREYRIKPLDSTIPGGVFLADWGFYADVCEGCVSRVLKSYWPHRHGPGWREMAVRLVDDLRAVRRLCEYEPLPLEGP